MKATDGIALPKKEGDAGYDLYADHSELIKVGRSCVFETAAVAIPDGYCGLIIGRSSMNGKGIITIFGLIDSGYRGYIRVVLWNVGEEDFLVAKGTAIAQMVLVPYGNFPIERVVSQVELPSSQRGTTGFGSTGE